MKENHSRCAPSTARRPHLRLVQPTELEPPPPASEADYRSKPSEDGYGKIPSTPIQEMQRRKGIRDLRALHRLRRINEPFEMWIDGGIDIDKLYSPAVLGWKSRFTIAEDFALKAITGRFPLIHPYDETAKDTRKRRHAFNIKAGRDSMHATAVRKPGVTRLQSLINALPYPPGRTTVKEVAAKLRSHPAWRKLDGTKMDLSSVIAQVNTLMRVYGGIMSVTEPPMRRGQQPTRFIWNSARTQKTP